MKQIEKMFSHEGKATNKTLELVCGALEINKAILLDHNKNSLENIAERINFNPSSLAARGSLIEVTLSAAQTVRTHAAHPFLRGRSGRPPTASLAARARCDVRRARNASAERERGTRFQSRRGRA